MTRKLLGSIWAGSVNSVSSRVTTAQGLVSELIDADVVTAVPEDRVLVYEPSGAAFDSSTQLAVFHRGWTAVRGADEESE